MDKLALYTFVDGVNDTPFPDAEEQLVLNEFTYTADRMGGAPTISATAMHSKCLDNLWSDKVYVSFRGEKLYVMNTPSSSKDNSDARYKHEVEFLSEREVLNHVYFIDAVQGDETVDVYKSNTSKVIFMGDIREFGKRLQACFDYLDLDYTVEFDETAISDEKLVSFEDKYILEALQEMYNTYEIPYYFKGKVVHIGSMSDYVISTPFEYGSKEALISVSKENANYAVINKIKGQGSSDNIPLYYPNTSAKGEIGIQYYDWNGIVEDSKASVTISDMDVFTEKVDLGDIYRYHLPTVSNVTTEVYKDGVKIEYEPDGIAVDPELFDYRATFKTKFTLNGSGEVKIMFRTIGIGISPDPIAVLSDEWSVSSNVSIIDSETETTSDGESTTLKIYILNKGTSEVTIDAVVDVLYGAGSSGSWKPNISVTPTTEGRFYNESTKEFVTLSDIGIGAVNNPFDGFGFSQEKIGWITPMTNLMPSIYRESKGAEQFYEAKNNTYEIPDGEGYYEFVNEFSKNNQRQGTTNFEEIKPTIVGITNASGQRIDMFTDFAFDENDNDEMDDEGNYLHPYFFAKLRKFDGENGFNLFNQAIESQTMQISFTSGVCGACSFEIGVGEETQKNIVQVDDSGNLKRDEDGNVLWEDQTPQDRQNDTINYEVWIALKKEDSTYGQVMPNATQNLKPSTDDTFVILGISLPQAYVLAAEKKLEESLIKAMWESNKEKFNFTIKPSRIYIKENEEELDKMLNENSTVIVRYDGVDYSMYVNSYSYKVDESNSLPEIELTVSDTLSQGSNSLQTQLDAIKEDILTYIGSTDFLKQGIKYFLRKDVSDKARGLITFLKGVQFGNYSEGVLGAGGAVSVGENGDSYAVFDYLTIRKKAMFTEITIQELKHIGGSLIISPAAMVVSEVEDVIYGYKCYFESEDSDGKKIYNQFELGDQARCQTFNLEEKGNGQKGNRYYWRLVTEVGDNYIVLSKTDADTNSDTPEVGDNITQLGNRNDTSRQNAQIYSAYGTDAPSRVMYQGIDSYSLDNKAIKYEGYDVTTNRFKEVTYGDAYFGDKDKNNFLSYSTDNGVEVKGKVTLEQGSTGASNLTDLPDEITKSVSVGSENLLLNTGFVGDYEPISLNSEDNLKDGTKLYNSSLKHWNGNAIVQEDSESLSGFSAHIYSLKQNIALIEGEKYTVSYKAKGNNVYTEIGGVSVGQNITSEYQRYKHTVTAQSDGFSIYGDCIVCEIKLERGTIATDWCPSVLDPSSVKDKFKDLWYLQSAMQGSTTTIGGLNLTSAILLGQFLDGEMKKVDAGVSGIYNDDDDVAFWAGGSFDEAIQTVQKLKDGYNPADTEWNSLAKFVATHGGDLFLRGYVYALGGLFRGRVEAGNDQKKVIIDPTNGSLGFYYMGKKRIEIVYGQISDSFSPNIGIYMYDKDGNITALIDESGIMFNTYGNEQYNVYASLGKDGIEFTQYPLTGGPKLLAKVGLSINKDAIPLSKLLLYGTFPTAEDTLSVGQVYQENGILKVKTE